MLGAALRFVVVGVSNTAIGLAVIYLAWRVGGWPDAAANALGYAVGIGWSFALNRRWTFRARDRVPASLARYLLVCGVAYVANLLAMLGARHALGADTFAPHLLGACVYTAVAFLGSHRYAFREH